MRYAFAVLALSIVLQQATTAEADGAAKVVAFNIVSDDRCGMTEVTYLAEVQPAIAHYIDSLPPALSARARPQKALKGVVTIIDERNDRITVRLTSDVTADFKVQDGLFFDSVRSGDPVEITVENIDGTKTIVGLKRTDAPFAMGLLT
jgi:hypothetical protein